MIVNIGRNIKKLQTGIIKDSYCPNCNHKNGLNYSIYGGFVNIVIIPTTPIKRTVVVECNNCKKTYKLKDLSTEIKKNFKNQYKKNPVKIPIWQFSGLFICAALISVAIYAGVQAKKAEKLYIQNPLAGDIYRINNDGHYTTLKVKSTTKDSINVYVNDMETNNYSGIDEINIDKNYNKIQLFSKENLKELFNENTIYQIDRD